MLITPSGIPYEEMGPDDLVPMGFDGPRPGLRRPSMEWRLHAGILDARPEVAAVVHAHPPYCTALSCLRRDIPAFHYMVAVAGGDSIRCSAYALFGTRELAGVALEALEGRKACLLANHGLVAVGESASDALALAIEVEALAQAYLVALRSGVEPVILGPDEMAEVLDQFKGYGQK
jgi:L-fuculose-phosphate aldolase